MPLPSPSTGGVVLCGGKSTRMGQSKAMLPFGNELLLQRVVRILGEVVSPIVVVAAEKQELPKLPRDVLIARDEYEALGPLAGIAVGLHRLRDRVEVAYVSSCDVPLLRPEFVRAMIGFLGDHDLAIPRDGKYHHPLAAVYRTRLEDDVQALIVENRLRPFFLLERVNAVEIDVDQLRNADPQLSSLRNTNTPADYEAALRDARVWRPVARRAVSQGRAVWGIAIDTVARQYGLDFIPLQEAHYDFAVARNRLNRPAVRLFPQLLSEPYLSERLRNLGIRL